MVLLAVCLLCFGFSDRVGASKAAARPNVEKVLMIHDTAMVLHFFDLGNQFIDGPSDSLMFYYQKAMEIIRANLDKYAKGSRNDALYQKFRLLEQRVYIEFGIEYFYQSEYAKALDHFFTALEIAEEIGEYGVLSECYSEIGIVYKNQGKLTEALVYFEKALAIAQKGDDSSWVASCMVNIGNIYKEKTLLITALNYYFDALKIFEKLGHSRRIAACYQSIGDVYGQQKDFYKAMEYYNRSLKLAIETEDKVRETGCYLSIGAVSAQKKDFKSARQYYYKALAIYKITGYLHQMDDCYILIGDAWLAEHNYDEATLNYERALEISLHENDIACISEILGNLAKIYFLEKDYQKAKIFCLKSLAFAEKSSSLDLMSCAHYTLSAVYEAIGEPNQALKHFKFFSNLKDTLFSCEKFKTITEMEVKYESEKKEQQLAILQQQNEVQQLKLESRKRGLIASFVGAGLILIIAYLLIRHSRLKAKQKATELEQRLLLSQMNPHFIFNSLIAIQGYIYQNEPILAGDFLAKFADLVRIILESSREGFISIEKEIKMLDAYLSLQKLRFENRFDYDISLDQQLNVQNVRVPAMLAQPFIENAVEHGLRHRSAGGFLKVAYSMQRECCIRITIEDNGVGREMARLIEKKQSHQSLAMHITNERIVGLSRVFKQKFSVQLIDLFDQQGNPSGLKVLMDLPVRKIGNFND